MKRWLKIALLGLTLVLLLLAGAVTWVANNDAWVERQIEKYASGALGRQLAIGSLEIAWGRRTHVQAGDITLANPGWASESDFLSVQTLVADVDLSSLLRRKVVVQSLELDSASLDLEEDAQGRVNWNFGTGADKGDDKSKPRGEIFPWEHLKVSAFEMTHRSPSRQAPLDFTISSLTANKIDGGRVDLKTNGTISGYDLSAEGYVDPLHALISGDPISANLSLTLGEISLQATGKASNGLTGEGADLQLEFKGPDFAWLLSQAALPEFSSGPFDAKATAKMQKDSTFAVEVDGDLGTLDARLDGTLDRFRKPSKADIKFEISGPDLQALGMTFGLETLPKKSFKTTGTAQYEPQALKVSQFQAQVGDDNFSLSGTVGDWPKLDGTALDVSASGSDISQWGPLMHFEHWLPNAYSVRGQVSEASGQITIKQGMITVGQSQSTLSGNLGQMPTLMGASLEVGLKVPDLREVIQISDFDRMPQLPIGVTGTASRKEDGVHFADMKLDYGGDTLDFTGVLAFSSQEASWETESWREFFSGSHIKGQLESSNVGRLARSFDVSAIPDERLKAGIDARLEKGQLTFSVAGANLGVVELDISGSLDHPPDTESGQASFNIKLPTLKAVEAFTPATGLPDLPATIQGSLQRFPEGVKLQNISGTVGDGKFEIDGEVRMKPELTIHDLKFSASGSDFRHFIDRTWLEGLPADFTFSGEVVAIPEGQQLNGISLTLGQVKADVNGTLDKLADPRRYDLTVQVSAPELSELNEWLSRFLHFELPGEPLSLAGKITSEGQTTDFTNIKAVLGKSDLDGSLAVTLGEVPKYQGTAKSGYLDLSWLEKDVTNVSDANLDAAGSDTERSASAKKGPTQVFSDAPLPILTWDPVVVDLSLQAGTVQLPRTSLSDVRLGLKLTDEQLVINPVEVTSENGGQFAGSVSLKESNGNVDAELIGTADGMKLGLAAGKNQDISTYPSWDLRVNMKANGNSMRALATTASGDVDVMVGAGQVAQNSLDLLFSDTMQELLSKLNPFSKSSDHTNLECGVGVVHFSEGIATVDPIIYQTDKIVVTSRGDVNLATEKLDLAFNTRARTGIGLSPGMVINPFIKLGGTLAQPSIILDAPRAAVTSGAAVATGGLSLLGESLFDRFLRQRDPCGKVVAELRKMERNESSQP